MKEFPKFPDIANLQKADEEGREEYYDEMHKQGWVFVDLEDKEVGMELLEMLQDSNKAHFQVFEVQRPVYAIKKIGGV